MTGRQADTESNNLLPHNNYVVQTPGSIMGICLPVLDWTPTHAPFQDYFIHLSIYSEESFYEVQWDLLLHKYA